MELIIYNKFKILSFSKHLTINSLIIRNGIRLIGVTSLIVFLSIFWSDWEFNSAWFPIVLMNIVFFSHLLEVYLWMNVVNRILEVKILFVFVHICLSVSSLYAGVLLSHQFLNFRTLIYENDEIMIEKSEMNKSYLPLNDYYLSKQAFGKLIVKEVEHIQKPKKSVDCEVKFMKHHVFYDECSKKFIP